MGLLSPEEEIQVGRGLLNITPGVLNVSPATVNAALMQQFANQRSANPRPNVTDFMNYGAGAYSWPAHLSSIAANINQQFKGLGTPENPIGPFGFGALGVTKVPKMRAMSADEWMTVYRGEYSGNKGGKFWTPDAEFARQFTQSGQEKEVLKKQIRRSEIMDFSNKVYAGDPDALEAAIKEAHSKGFKAVMVNEGAGQPNSLYWFGDNPRLPF